MERNMAKADKKETTNETAQQGTVEQKKQKEYAPTDTIRCRSAVQGELLYPAQKSGNLYVWANYGDECYVEYQDLLPLLLTRSRYLYEPFFVILDEELVNSARFEALKNMYETFLSYEDVTDILNLPFEQFKTALLAMPRGMVNAVQVEISNQLDNKTFDSIQKLQFFNETYGTSLSF